MRKNNHLTYYRGREKLPLDEECIDQNQNSRKSGEKQHDFVHEMYSFGAAVGDLYETAGAAWGVIQKHAYGTSLNEDCSSSYEYSSSEDFSDVETDSDINSSTFGGDMEYRSTSMIQRDQRRDLLGSLRLQAREIERVLVEEDMLEEQIRIETKGTNVPTKMSKQCSSMNTKRRLPSIKNLTVQSKVARSSESVATSRSGFSCRTKSSMSSISSFKVVASIKKSASKVKQLVTRRTRKHGHSSKSHLKSKQNTEAQDIQAPSHEYEDESTTDEDEATTVCETIDERDAGDSDESDQETISEGKPPVRKPMKHLLLAYPGSDEIELFLL